MRAAEDGAEPESEVTETGTLRTELTRTDLTIAESKVKLRGSLTRAGKGDYMTRALI